MRKIMVSMKFDERRCLDEVWVLVESYVMMRKIKVHVLLYAVGELREGIRKKNGSYGEDVMKKKMNFVLFVFF